MFVEIFRASLDFLDSNNEIIAAKHVHIQGHRSKSCVDATNLRTKQNQRQAIHRLCWWGETNGTSEAGDFEEQYELFVCCSSLTLNQCLDRSRKMQGPYGRNTKTLRSNLVWMMFLTRSTPFQIDFDSVGPIESEWKNFPEDDYMIRWTNQTIPTSKKQERTSKWKDWRLLVSKRIEMPTKTSIDEQNSSGHWDDLPLKKVDSIFYREYQPGAGYPENNFCHSSLFLLCIVMFLVREKSFFYGITRCAINWDRPWYCLHRTTVISRVQHT